MRLFLSIMSRFPCPSSASSYCLCVSHHEPPGHPRRTLRASTGGGVGRDACVACPPAPGACTTVLGLTPTPATAAACAWPPAPPVRWLPAPQACCTPTPVASAACCWLASADVHGAAGVVLLVRARAGLLLRQCDTHRAHAIAVAPAIALRARRRRAAWRAHWLAVAARLPAAPQLKPTTAPEWTARASAPAVPDAGRRAFFRRLAPVATRATATASEPALSSARRHRGAPGRGRHRCPACAAVGRHAGYRALHLLHGLHPLVPHRRAGGRAGQRRGAVSPTWPAAPAAACARRCAATVRCRRRARRRPTTPRWPSRCACRCTAAARPVGLTFINLPRLPRATL